MGAERVSQPGDDLLLTLRNAAEVVINNGNLPATLTSDGISLLTGVTLPWETLIDSTGGRADTSDSLYYLLDSAIRAGISLPVWSDVQWNAGLTVLAFPVSSLLHPGVRWTREAIRGNALTIGFGARNLDTRYPDRVLPLLPEVLDACGITLASPVWGNVRAQHEHIGTSAGMLTRLQRGPNLQLRPTAGMDVLTLLASQRFREELAHRAGGSVPMVAVAAPSRTHGWVLSAVDTPEFTEAIAMATALETQGSARPLLITPLEVVEGKRKSDFDQ